MSTTASLARHRKEPESPVHQKGEMPEIHLIGRMRAVTSSDANLLPRAKKTRCLLAYLCLARGETVQRSHIAGLLWDRSPESQARTNLRHALMELKEAFTPAFADLIETGQETIRFDISRCRIDVLEDVADFERILEDLRNVSASFDDWLLTERTHYEKTARRVLESELDRVTRSKAPPELRVAAARKLLDLDPTDEVAVRSIMTAYTQMGEHARAVREYDRCEAALKQRLDTSPSPKTVKLYDAVRLAAHKSGSPSNGAVQATEEIAESSGNERIVRGDAASPVRSPSIAVLPFHNLSPDTRYDYALGLAVDLNEALSRVPGLFVISRLSTSMFGNQDRNPEEIGGLLGVQYVLSGSVRIVSDRLRLNCELADARDGRTSWAMKFESPVADLDNIEGLLVRDVVQRIGIYLRTNELTRSKRSNRPDAYDLLLRAQEDMHNSSRPVFENAERLFDAALARDPYYAAALASRAFWHVLRVGQGWSLDPGEDARQAEHFAQRAVDSNELEPTALAVQGHVASYLRKDFALAFQRFEKALHINPNAAAAWMWSADAHAWEGNGARAVSEIETARALSPFDPMMFAYSGAAAMAYLVDGQYDRAVEFARRSVRENSTYTSGYKLLLMSLVLADREAEVPEPLRRLLNLEAGFTVDAFRRRYPGSASPYGELFCFALARAGVPLRG